MSFSRELFEHTARILHLSVGGGFFYLLSFLIGLNVRRCIDISQSATIRNKSVRNK